MTKLKTIQKYLFAALTPVLVFGVQALRTWSVTRNDLSLLIIAEAAALGIYVVPNEPRA